MADSYIDISVMGKILLGNFNEQNPNKFKLAVIYSLMGGHARIYTLSNRVFKSYKNKKGHSALFQVKIDEAINELIAEGVIIVFGTNNSSVKLSKNYLDTFNKLKSNLECDDKNASDKKNVLQFVDSFQKAEYLPFNPISNQDEINWIFKQVLINIRQRTNVNCKDCNYFKTLIDNCFENIDLEKIKTSVDFGDEVFTKLTQRLKKIQHKSADLAVR